MIDWLRRVDPAFYYKEPHVLRTEAQIPRYPDDAQAAVRQQVLSDDRIVHVATTIVALAAWAAATGSARLDPHRDWFAAWALAFLAAAVPLALPWRPRPGTAATVRHALIGSALMLIPSLWFRVDTALIGIALLTGAMVFAARGRVRLALLVVAVAILFAVRVPPFVVPLVVMVTAGASVLVVYVLARVWRLRPQVVTWSAFATVLVVCAYTVAFNAPVVASRIPAEIIAIIVAYLGICIIAGRIRRAELLARPDGVLSLPQSIVPLLNRSRHHAIICWSA